MAAWPEERNVQARTAGASDPCKSRKDSAKERR